MPKVAEEIRSELVRVISNNGGHLASNLGVVELTMALHRVFETPKDHVIFDVGHQSYVHKMLTGRYDQFDTIRQAVSAKLDEVRSEASVKWALISEWFANNVAPKFTLRFWLDKFKNLKEGFTQTIKNMLNAGIDMLNQFIGWLNSKLTFSWDGLSIAGKEIYPGGSVQLLSIPQITQRFANGGFIEDGLFTMNHGEIAGRFSNGQSVVANNQQIVEGIAAGVYEAVVAAMNATSGRQGQSVNVYLDGRQITAAVEKRQSERGMQLIGDQLGYAY
jgi:hypothetical protein